jgi:hypothetical protein
MAIGIEIKGESYGLLIDAVGEVMKLREQRCEPKPVQSRSRGSRASRPAFPARRPAHGRARRRSRAGHQRPARRAWQGDGKSGVPADRGVKV